MTKEQEGYALAGTVIDEQVEVTLEEISLYCSVRREQIVALVEEGVVEPKSGARTEWRFAGHSLNRAAKAIRLQRELDLDLSAVALVLDLLEQIDALRFRLQLVGVD
jgi:chaperone modulatory protein CbpM